MPTRGFVSHIDLVVSDLDTSITFYALLLDYLGMERVRPEATDRATWRLVVASGAHFELEIRLPRGPSSSSMHVRDDPGIDHLAFHAESTGDVDGLYELLTGAGYAVDEPPRFYDYSPGYYAVGFDDPDRIRLELAFDPSTNPSRASCSSTVAPHR